MKGMAKVISMTVVIDSCVVLVELSIDNLLVVYHCTTSLFKLRNQLKNAFEVYI